MICIQSRYFRLSERVTKFPITCQEKPAQKLAVFAFLRVTQQVFYPRCTLLSDRSNST
jgi:hypothetical protein